MKKYILSFFVLFALFQINQSFAETPDYINKLIQSTNSSYYELNKWLEFVDENWIKSRLQTYSCYTLNSSNYYNFSYKWYILKTSNWSYCFADIITKEEKILYKKSSSYFKSLNFNLPLSLENNIYYAYKFSKYYHFEDLEWFYLSDFSKLWYTKNNIIILVNNWKYYIIKDFQRIKLFEKDFISSIKNKVKFLTIIYDDIKKSDISSINIRTNLEKIKAISSNFKSTDKTKESYNWVLSNISYFTENLNTTANTSIFSGLYTFQNKIWVCDWYTKTFAYLLMFSWIENVELKTWFVINSDLFPTFGHAWVKIWNYYYDPTFDDPIWQKSTKTFNDYKYFRLPKDIIYTNRFDWTNIDENLKKSSLETRKLLVEKRLYDIAKLYINSDYNILKLYITKNNLWLKFNEKLDISKAKNLFSYFEVNNDYSYSDKYGNTKYIKNILYYAVTDASLENTFAQIFSYNSKWVYLIKWDLWNWKYEYRLSNNIKF